MFEFKQKVWCVMFGEGVVRNILASDTRFPLVVEFNGKLECYTLDGKYYDWFGVLSQAPGGVQ